MRAKVDPKDRCKTRGISLHPKLLSRIQRKIGNKIGFSEYFQELAAYDIENDVLGKAILAKFQGGRR